MIEATSTLSEWRYVAETKASRRTRVLQLFIAAGSLFFAFYVVKTLLSPPMWWAQDGLAIDPGKFLGQMRVDYPVCSPWIGRDADFARREWKMTEVSTPRQLTAGDPLNLGVLLPKNAQVMKIYCATESAECSWIKCDPPLTFMIMDGMYVHGRVLVLMLANMSTKKSHRAVVRLWVLWK